MYSSERSQLSQSELEPAFSTLRSQVQVELEHLQNSLSAGTRPIAHKLIIQVEASSLRRNDKKNKFDKTVKFIYMSLNGFRMIYKYVNVYIYI